ncbi:dopamine receptor 1-like [Tubulanus polymorphus]|uniref:dopamine receptor 1-like n=1 Tax=Tubulanus polymorphus TaxID=672921 RepID=UPI003DA1E1FD
MSINYTVIGLNESLAPKEPEPKYSGVKAVVIVIILSLVIIVSIAGNLLVVIAVCTERALRKTTNFFYVSLAIADLMVSTMVMTFAVANDILGYWTMGVKFCSVWISFDIMCSTSSILNLCTISLDRYIHIRFPLRYEACMTARMTLSVIAGVWVCSALISFVPIQLGWHGTKWEDFDTGSAVFYCYLELNSTYAIVSSCVSFYVPCAIMIGIYFKMYQYARKHVKSIKQVTTGPDHADRQSRISDQKAAITLGVIMGTFLFCYIPFFTTNVVASFCNDCVSSELFSGLSWLGYVNSCFNPVIYSIFNKEFRKAFYKILCMKSACCEKEQPLSSYNYKHRSTGSTNSYTAAQVELIGSVNGSSRHQTKLGYMPP